MIHRFNETDPLVTQKIQAEYGRIKDAPDRRKLEIKRLAFLNTEYWLKNITDLKYFSSIKTDSLNILEEVGKWFLLFEVCSEEIVCLMHKADPGSLRHVRAKQYYAFFKEIISLNKDLSRNNYRFLVYIKDISPSHIFTSRYKSTPFFCFQKPVWSNGIMIPDLDFINNLWYERICDTEKFEDKINKVTFSGSTTGINDHSGLTGVETQSLERLTLPRIRAAEYLKDADSVIFRLPNIVQCRSSDVIKELDKKEYTKFSMEIIDSLRYKFILSIDGNGANCSRVAIGLKSNCALIKYESVMELYYFRLITKMKHFIPVTAEYQISEICKLESINNGLFESISVEGKRFFESYLTVWSTCKYLEEVIRCYCL